MGRREAPPDLSDTLDRPKLRKILVENPFY